MSGSEENENGQGESHDQQTQDKGSEKDGPSGFSGSKPFTKYDGQALERSVRGSILRVSKQVSRIEGSLEESRMQKAAARVDDEVGMKVSIGTMKSSIEELKGSIGDVKTDVGKVKDSLDDFKVEMRVSVG
jgi:hypothetical protein